MPIPQIIFLYPGNTQVLNVEGLQDIVTGNFLNNAQVSATLVDARNNADPVLNNISLGYLAGSNGNYQGTVPSSFSPPAFKAGTKSLGGFSLVVTAIQAAVQSIFTIPVMLQLRNQ